MELTVKHDLIIPPVLGAICILVFAKAPDCGCFSLVRLHEEGRSSAAWALGRNAALFGLLALPIGARGPQRSRSLPPVATNATRPGFSLLELLIVIALVAVVVALVIPGLERVRTTASRSRSLAQAASHAAVFSQYTSDWGDHFPAFTDPRARWTFFRVDDEFYKTGYMDAYWSWHIFLAERIYGTTYRDPIFHGKYNAGPMGAEYSYSHTFLADPAYWNLRTRTGPAQWRATRAAEVAFPSHKALFYAHANARSDQIGKTDEQIEQMPKRVPPPSLLAFVDGHGQAVPREKLQPGVGAGPGVTGDGLPGMTTLDGVRGRDVR